eukprot:CAMPEP_0180658358 /NCGR_PEP_ID=MMETSP1037_2-20121125/56960_1 /TAXON_ID=632150 /ORGANISM="Azadinium spinosum, Strain 3D9" /LENGTH=53 /DNA_ID=CAMNT_0022685237 /DNA_START=82 /DNA_END=240 /DNA_ORIENTATION=+
MSSRNMNCVIKMTKSSSFGSHQNNVDAAPPHAKVPVLWICLLREGSTTTLKPK